MPAESVEGKTVDKFMLQILEINIMGHCLAVG